jgi:hypothetical protein
VIHELLVIQLHISTPKTNPARVMQRRVLAIRRIDEAYMAELRQSKQAQHTVKTILKRAQKESQPMPRFAHARITVGAWIVSGD